MEQDAQEHEDHVDDVQVQVEALGDEVVDDVGKAQHQGDDPEDAAVLDLLSGGVDGVGLLLFLHQNGGVHSDGVLGIGMHGVVDQGHQDEDDQHHAQVHGMEDGLGDGGGVHHTQDLGAALGAHLQGDGAGQAGVPDDEAGVGRGDQQGIVHVLDPAGHLLGQQGAGDEAEAPVEPAADGGDEGGDQDGALLVLGNGGNGAQDFLTDLGGSHGGAQHQHQSHLHGEGQQAPEAAGVTPGVDQSHGALLGADHRGDEDHDGQDDGEQERIRQPPVDDPHAAIGKLFEHAFPSLFFSTMNKPQHNLFTISVPIIYPLVCLSTDRARPY